MGRVKDFMMEATAKVFPEDDGDAFMRAIMEGDVAVTMDELAKANDGDQNMIAELRKRMEDINKGV